MRHRAARVAVIGMDAISLPQVRMFAEEGCCPNFAWMLREGAANEALPCIPAYTPTNWATIATGAYPGSHGAGNWQDKRVVPSARQETLSTFDSRAIEAEFIWEAAERAGKRALLMAYPGAYPPRTREGFVVVPLERGLRSHTIVPGAEYASEGEEGCEPLTLGEPSGWSGRVPTGAKEGVIRVPVSLSSDARSRFKTGDVQDGDREDAAADAGAADAAETEGVSLPFLAVRDDSGWARVLICSRKDIASRLAEIRPGEWSDWAYLPVSVSGESVQASVRFKLLDNARGEPLRIIRSELYPSPGITHPDSLGPTLLDRLGPYIEHASLPPAVALRAASDGQELDTVLGEIEYQADWLAGCAEYLWDRWELMYLHWHWPDSVLHVVLGLIDPDSPNYDADRAPALTELLRRTYVIGDRLLGRFLNRADDDCGVIVVSDHGNSPNRYVCALTRRLAESGLFACDGEPERPERIHWDKTQAYLHGSFQICVNLQGREPEGIVPPEDYQAVQERIIDALLSWREPATGRRAVALALKKKDAQLIGYYGDRVGDVVFIYNSGFAWGRPPDGSSASPAPGGANHGPQIPTTRTRFSSDLAALLVQGPGVKGGYQRDAERFGLMRLVDVTPTVAGWMGFDPPAHSQGSVLSDLFE